MSEPGFDKAVQAEVQRQLAAQAEAVTGDPAAAGVYGDPAGAAEPSQASLDLSKAQAVAVNVADLLERIQGLEAQAQAAAEALNPPEPEPDYSLHADPCAPGWLHDLVGRIEARFAALEPAKPEPAVQVPGTAGPAPAVPGFLRPPGR